MRKRPVDAPSSAREVVRRGFPPRAATIALLVATVLPAASRPANAQQESVRTLSLDDAVRLAERNSPAVRRAATEHIVARTGVREAMGAMLPGIFTGLNFGGSSFHRVTAFDEFGNLVTLDDPLVSRSSSASQSVDLDITLFDAGARRRELRAARLIVDAADARADASRLELRAEVARRYYQAVGAEKRIALEERLLVSARDQLAATERLFRVAGASRADVLGSEADVAAREGALETARGEARKQLVSVREILAVEDTVTLVLADSLPSLSRGTPFVREAVLARALGASPRLMELAARAEAMDRMAGAARSSRWPVISARAGFSRSLYDRDYNALFELNPPDRSFNFGFSASLPLFDRFQRSARIARADAAADNAREEIRAARFATIREVETAFIDLENAQRRVLLSQRSVALSREREELSRESYRVGAIRLIELQLVLDRTAAAEREELDARVALAVARATLEEKVGGEIPD